MNNKDGQVDSVCRFGPGGDFISVWPAKYPLLGLQTSLHPLTRMLTLLTEIVTTLFGLEPDTTSAVQTNTQPEADQILSGRGVEYADEGTRDRGIAYSGTAAIIRGQDQPALFADDCRGQSRGRHKPKRHIRAHRRTTKKTSHISFPGQRLLFEADFKSAKTA